MDYYDEALMNACSDTDEDGELWESIGIADVTFVLSADHVMVTTADGGWYEFYFESEEGETFADWKTAVNECLLDEWMAEWRNSGETTERLDY